MHPTVHFFRRCRELPDRHAHRVLDRIDDRRRRRINHDLTDGFGAERPGRFIAALEFHPDISNVQTAGDLVLHKGIAVIFSLFAVYDILKERHADTLGDAALGLHPGKSRIDHCSAVHHGRVVHHLYHAGLFVDLHLGDAGHRP